MALPKLDDNVIEFTGRRTRVLSRAFRSGRLRAEAVYDQEMASEENSGSHLERTEINIFTLTHLLDAFIGQAGPEAYLIIVRKIREPHNFDFESGVEFTKLESTDKFDVVKRYISESLNVELSDDACANIVLKIAVEIYGKLVNNIPMSNDDRLILEQIKSSGDSFKVEIPTKKVGEVHTKVDANLLSEVPLSIRKVYEASAAWQTAQREAAQEDSEKLQAGALKAFSLM